MKTYLNEYLIKVFKQLHFNIFKDNDKWKRYKNYKQRVRTLFLIKSRYRIWKLINIITLLMILCNFTNGKYLRIINRELGIYFI